ncbi:MAG: FMN-binding negative transcriptional regulator [Pseudomonas sp.]|uniref:FMN-binding negative transcriptional regulator n=1 Tax=Pseudomonas sp. TaxID=306 RepID=UPI003D6EA2A5
MSLCSFHYREYRCKDQSLINRFIDTFPLALITSERDGNFHCSHIPLLLNPDGTLFGHVDRRNPQFMNAESLKCHIAFVGPSGYIPPEAYQNTQLPTWNYLAVHMQASIDVIDNENINFDLLLQSSRRFAPINCDERVDSRDPRVIRNLPHIFGLLIRPENIEGRFKLSQDKPSEDQSSALNWLIKQQTINHKQLFDFVSALNFHENSNANRKN